MRESSQPWSIFPEVAACNIHRFETLSDQKPDEDWRSRVRWGFVFTGVGCDVELLEHLGVTLNFNGTIIQAEGYVSAIQNDGPIALMVEFIILNPPAELDALLLLH